MLNPTAVASQSHGDDDAGSIITGDGDTEDGDGEEAEDGIIRPVAFVVLPPPLNGSAAEWSFGESAAPTATRQSAPAYVDDVPTKLRFLPLPDTNRMAATAPTIFHRPTKACTSYC